MIDGVVFVNGGNGLFIIQVGGGSGGGIYIEFFSFVGYGVVRVNGGIGYYGIWNINVYSEC